jgi:hypothetical protein
VTIKKPEAAMELLVAPVEHITFNIEAGSSLVLDRITQVALSQQLGAQPLPFPGMDKSGAAVCEFYVRTSCTRGAACPFRHVRGDKTIVCKVTRISFRFLGLLLIDFSTGCVACARKATSASSFTSST